MSLPLYRRGHRTNDPWITRWPAPQPLHSIFSFLIHVLLSLMRMLIGVHCLRGRAARRVSFSAELLLLSGVVVEKWLRKSNKSFAGKIEMLEPEKSIQHGFKWKCCLSLVISIGMACQSLMESILWQHRGKQAVLVFSCCGCRQSADSGACTVSVVVPDLCSLFSPKLNLKQGLLSDPEGYMFALIKTTSLMDKDINVWNLQGGMFFFIGCRGLLGRWHSTHCLCENTCQITDFFYPLFDRDRFYSSHGLFSLACTRQIWIWSPTETQMYVCRKNQYRSIICLILLLFCSHFSLRLFLFSCCCTSLVRSDDVSTVIWLVHWITSSSAALAV